MTTLDVTGGFRTQPMWQDLIGALVAGWQNFRRRREQRRAMVAISRLAPHLIRDVGFDPERIHDGLGGAWDQVQPVVSGSAYS